MVQEHHHSPPPESYESPFFHLDETLVVPYSKKCFQCGHVKSTSFICSACRTMCYCSVECQKNAWKKHKAFCKVNADALKQLHVREKEYRKAIEELEQQRRTDDSHVADVLFDMSIPVDRHPIRFPYYEILGALCTGYSKVGTIPALKSSIALTIKLLQLDRRDPYHMSAHLPYTFMRLVHDQLAYDVIKWYGLLPDCQDCYMAVPLLNISNADLSEDVTLLLNDKPNSRFKLSLHHLIPLLLIKTRLLQHFIKVDKLYHFLACVERSSNAVTSDDATEGTTSYLIGKLAGNGRVLHRIKSFLLDSQHLPSRKFSIKDKYQLMNQIIAIVDKAGQLNKQVWGALFHAESLFGADYADRPYYGKRSYQDWSNDELKFLETLLGLWVKWVTYIWWST